MSRTLASVTLENDAEQHLAFGVCILAVSLKPPNKNSPISLKYSKEDEEIKVAN